MHFGIFLEAGKISTGEFKLSSYLNCALHKKKGVEKSKFPSVAKWSKIV